MKSRIKNNIVYILLFIIILIPSIFDCEEFMFIRAFALFINIILLIFIIRQRNISFRIIPLLILGIYILSSLYHYLFSVNAYNIRLHFNEYSIYFLIPVIISLLKFNKDKYIKYVFHAIIIGGIIQILFSLPQLFAGANRIEGLTPYPNFLSFYLVLAFSACLYFALRMLVEKKKMGIIYIVLGIFILFMTFKTGSRNIFILLPAGILLISFIFNKKIAITMFILSIIIILILPSNAKNRLFNEAEINPYGVQRENIYKQVLKIGVRNLPMGIGYNNLNYYALKDNFPVEGRVGRYAASAKIAHNEYLEWFANAGVLGILILLLLLYAVIWFIRNRGKSKENKLIISFIILFSIFSLIDNALYLPMCATIFVIMLAYLFNKQMTVKYRIIQIIVIIIIVFNIFVSISDIVLFKYYYNVLEKIKGNYQEMSMDELRSLSAGIHTIFNIDGKPDRIEKKLIVDKYIFTESGYVDDFYSIISDYSTLIKYDKMNYGYYLGTAQLFVKYKSTILRRNSGNDSIINDNYLKAIELNPYNPFLRHEYADYLLSINDTTLAENQLVVAIFDEPYFLNGYRKLYELTNDEKYMEKIISLEKKSEQLSKIAKIEYEKNLLK